MSFHGRIASFALSAIVVATLPACRKSKPAPAPPGPAPTEERMVVVADVAPGLRRAKTHQHSDVTARKGDVLRLVKPADSVEWSDKVEGDLMSRSGPMLEVKRAETDNAFFVFASDVRDRARVVTASHVCSLMPPLTAPSAPCDQALRRGLLPDGATVGFVTCAEGECPLIIVSDKAPAVTRLAGLDDLRVARLGNRDLLLASTHSSAEGKTGQELVVLSADASFQRLATIPIVEADPSKPDLLTWQIGAWKLTADGIRVQGERAVVERATNRRLSTTMIDDTWGMNAQGGLERKSTAPSASR